MKPGGSEATLLYLHGLGCTKEDFLEACRVPELVGHTLVGFDFPGCGGSRTYYPEVPLGIDDLVEITRKVVAQLGLKRPTVIGHSLGGLTAIQFACLHVDLVSRLVDVEGNLAPEDCEIQSRDVFRHRFLGDEDRFFERVKDRLSARGRPEFIEFARAIRKNIAERAYFDYCRSIVDYSDGHPLLERFIALPVPRLFIHGDANSNLSYLRRLAEAGVPVVSVPGSDHFPARTNPGFYHEAIARFCALA